MLRVPLSKPYLQRPLKVNYGWTQQTPKGLLLDPAWDRSVDIWPGMVAMRTGGDKVTLIGAGGVPYGLIGQFIGGDGIDELLEANFNGLAVWVLGPDAESTVQAPAFDTAASWVDPTDGTSLLVHASTAGANRGKLVPAGATNASARPIAKLLRVDSAKQIVIGGLTEGDFEPPAAP